MQWLGAGSGAWWAHSMLHTGGRTLVRLVAAAALLAWALSFWPNSAWSPRLRATRRETGFVTLAMILSVSLVGLLQALTNVACPWDLVEFGDLRPYVELLALRPADLAPAQCFPGSHSASGVSLLAFYFVLLPHSRRAARIALIAALCIGAAFAFGQEARGAHFLSHDLTSALLVWLTLVGLHATVLRSAVAPTARSLPRNLAAIVHPEAT
jgi:membrane-associated PAP2 superfamily phosphatase